MKGLKKSKEQKIENRIIGTDWMIATRIFRRRICHTSFEVKLDVN